MRIDEVFAMNNIVNKQKYTSPDMEYQIFVTKNSSSNNNIPSYFSEPKYLELKELVMKYDLSENFILNSEKLNFASKCRNSFIKNFGILKSSSMQDLVLKPLSPNYDMALNDNINKMRKECREESDYSKSLKIRMKERKIGNCTDIALVTADDINQKQDKYKAKLVYASIVNDDMISNHVAVFVKDKKESNGLNSESIILDNWLGGVFKYSDWLKIVKKIYKSNDVRTYIENNQ